MSGRREDQAIGDLIGLTIGCIVTILSVFTFGLYHAVRYRPQPYSPIGPDRPRQQEGKNRMAGPWWPC